MRQHIQKDRRLRKKRLNEKDYERKYIKEGKIKKKQFKGKRLRENIYERIKKIEG